MIGAFYQETLHLHRQGVEFRELEPVYIVSNVRPGTADRTGVGASSSASASIPFKIASTSSVRIVSDFDRRVVEARVRLQQSEATSSWGGLAIDERACQPGESPVSVARPRR